MDLMNLKPLVVSLALNLSFLISIFVLASCQAHVRPSGCSVPGPLGSGRPR